MKRGAQDTDLAAESAFAAAREICRRHAGGLYFATTFLPPPKRRAAHAVYAFYRLLLEAMDQPASQADAPAAPATGSCCSTNSLDQAVMLIGKRLDEIYDGQLDLPLPEFRDQTQQVLYAFGQTVRRYEIPRAWFLEWVEGCRMDAATRRYATWTALEKYCARAEGVLARITSCILGLTHSDAHRQAVQLGNAIRLTNILRDLKQDWERGRIYLPLEDLARFGYRQRELAGGIVNDQFRELMRFEIARARELYRQGAAGICWLGDDGSRLAASAIVLIHSGILSAIERSDFNVFTRRAELTSAQKFRRLASAWRLARRTDGQRVPDVF